MESPYVRDANDERRQFAQGYTKGKEGNVVGMSAATCLGKKRVSECVRGPVSDASCLQVQNIFVGRSITIGTWKHGNVDTDMDLARY